MSVENMIKNLKDGDNVNESKEFKAVMADKITNALDAEKIKHVPGLGFLGSRLDKLYGSKQVAEAMRGTPGKLDGAIQNSRNWECLAISIASEV